MYVMRMRLRPYTGNGRALPLFDRVGGPKVHKPKKK